LLPRARGGWPVLWGPPVRTPGCYGSWPMAASGQRAAAAGAVGLLDPLPPDPLLPQAARLMPMATAAAAIMMRRIGTVPTRRGAQIAPADCRRDSLSFSLRVPQVPGGRAAVNPLRRGPIHPPPANRR